MKLKNVPVVHAGPGSGKTTLFKKMPNVFFDPEDCPAAVRSRKDENDPFYALWQRKPWRKDYDGYKDDLKTLNLKYVEWAEMAPKGTIIVSNVAFSSYWLAATGAKLTVTCFRPPVETRAVMERRATSGKNESWEKVLGSHPEAVQKDLPSQEVVDGWYKDWSRSVGTDILQNNARPEWLDSDIGLLILRLGTKHYLSDYADTIIAHIRNTHR